jgi:hypothetical protein
MPRSQIDRIMSRVEQIRASRNLRSGSVGSQLVAAESLHIGDRFLFGGRLFDVVDIKPADTEHFIRVSGEYGANHIDIEYMDVEAVLVQLPRATGPRSLR